MLFHRWGAWVSERLTDLPKFTQLENSRTGLMPRFSDCWPKATCMSIFQVVIHRSLNTQILNSKKKTMRDVFPTKTFILQNHNATIKIRKLTLIHYCHLISDPIQWCPFSKKIHFRITLFIYVHVSFVSFSLKQFPSLSLIFITGHLKITGQLFCSMYFNLICLIIDS